MLFGGYAMKWDVADEFMPYRHFAAECWRHGTLPLWCPYTRYGFPLHADPQGGAFYLPAMLLGLPFGYDFTAVALEHFMHAVWAGLGFYFLSLWLTKRWWVALLVGVSYACCGVFIANAQHTSWVAAASWLPWIAYCFVRTMQKPTVYLATASALCLGLAATGSYPAFLLVLAYVLAVTWVVIGVERNKARDMKSFVVATAWWLGSCVMGLLYASFPLVSFARAYPLIDRQENMQAIFQQGPFPVSAWLSFLLPVAALTPKWIGHTDISMANAYVGLVPLLALPLVVWSQRRGKAFLFLTLALLLLLVAAGDATPLREWLFRFAPGMNTFRFPSMFRVFAIGFLLLSTGYTLSNNRLIYRLTAMNRRLVKRYCMMLLAVLVVVISVIVLTRHDALTKAAVGLYKTDPTVEYGALALNAVLQLACVGLLLLAIAVVRRKASYVFSALVAVQVFNFVVLCMPNVYSTGVSSVKAQPLNARIDSLDRLPLQNLITSVPASHYGDVNMHPSFFNVNVLEKRIAHDGYNPFVLKAYTLLEADTAAYDQSIRSTLVHAEPASQARLQTAAHTPNRLLLKVDANEPVQVVYQQCYYPGWHCRVDGYETDLSNASTLLSTTVGRGRHDLEFYYRPDYVWLWWLMPVLAIGLGGVALSGFRKPN